ncbi:hypothetical protein MPNT_80039 [Candidatus Methylacidithermus pantelleriae]|uniref:Uncharacterized protein n=1 Tax=Candidatus Methylacidithermus pantelleriae TaxID=2744239 RepID=A0A8J2FTI3_9BACT|nr:hypothetical protein MPNT_80039 [Candidatus Methylacidithermus pantelleriae]
MGLGVAGGNLPSVFRCRMIAGRCGASGGQPRLVLGKKEASPLKVSSVGGSPVGGLKRPKETCARDSLRIVMGDRAEFFAHL